MEKIFEKLKTSYPEGILSFILEEPCSNKLTTCFLIVLKADDSFFEKYNIGKELLDPSNKNTKFLFQAKGIQSRFNERIEERKDELKILLKEKDFKEKMIKQYGTTKIDEIIEKEKEGFFKELIQDKSDKKFSNIMNKLKPDIMQMKLIQSIEQVVEKPKNREDASKMEDHKGNLLIYN